MPAYFQPSGLTFVSAQQGLLAQGLGGPLAGQVGAGDAAGLDLGDEGVVLAAGAVVVGEGDELGHQGGGGPVAGAVDAADLGLTQALDQLVAVGAAHHGHGGESSRPVVVTALPVVAVGTGAEGIHGLGDDAVQLAGRGDDGEAVLVAVAGLLPASGAAQGLGDGVGALGAVRLDAHAEAVAVEQAHGDDAQGAGSDDGVVVGAFGAGDVQLGLEHDVVFRELGEGWMKGRRS